MIERFANTLATRLTESISASQIAMRLEDFSQVPDLADDEYIYFTLVDECSQQVEIVKATHPAGLLEGTYIIERAQQGTTAYAFSTDATVYHSLTAQTAQRLSDYGAFYLGDHASPPLVDLNGDPVSTGQIYFDTTFEAAYRYDGTGWGLLTELSPVLGTYSRLTYQLDAGVAAGGRVGGLSSNGKAMPDLVLTETELNVYLNGVRLSEFYGDTPPIFFDHPYDFTIDYVTNEIVFVEAVPPNSLLVVDVVVFPAIDYDDRYLVKLSDTLLGDDPTDLVSRGYVFTIDPGVGENPVTGLFNTINNAVAHCAARVRDARYPVVMILKDGAAHAIQHDDPVVIPRAQVFSDMVITGETVPASCDIDFDFADTATNPNIQFAFDIYAYNVRLSNFSMNISSLPAAVPPTGSCVVRAQAGSRVILTNFLVDVANTNGDIDVIVATSANLRIGEGVEMQTDGLAGYKAIVLTTSLMEIGDVHETAGDLLLNDFEVFVYALSSRIYQNSAINVAFDTGNTGVLLNASTYAIDVLSGVLNMTNLTTGVSLSNGGAFHGAAKANYTTVFQEVDPAQPPQLVDASGYKLPSWAGEIYSN